MLTEHKLKTDKKDESKQTVHASTKPAKANVRKRVKASKQEIPITAVRVT